jgi:hypothetical protein
MIKPKNSFMPIVAKGNETPHFQYIGGLTLPIPNIYNLFLGGWWNKNKDMCEYVNKYTKILASWNYTKSIDEYLGVTQPSFAGWGIFNSIPFVKTLSDKSIQNRISCLLKSGSIKKFGDQTVFFVYLQDGLNAKVVGQKTCDSLCGYHNNFHDKSYGVVFYAVIPYMNCSVCNPGMDIMSSMSVVASHELIETMTDPVPGTGWYSMYHNEIGDVCAWQTKKLEDIEVQLVWSNKNGKCV